MTSNPEPIVQQVQHEFQNLLAYVTGPEARSQTAYTVELTLFRRLLALGAALLRLFFVTRAAVRPAEPVTAPDGTRLTYHDQRPTTYYSVFGKVCFGRPYFTARGQAGLCPLDAELSLPARCYSDLLREWAAYGTTDESYRESQTVLERILGLSLSLQALETGVIEAAGMWPPSTSSQRSRPPAPPVGTILVVQADGKGVPMVQPPPRRRPCAWARGRSARKKKEAVVTALYTIAPYPRTPQDVVAALLQDASRPELAARPRPVGKELRATLEGKAVAMSRLVQRVAQREGPHIQQRVALTDGAEALQQQLVTHVPAYTLVLDIIHATEYLWDSGQRPAGGDPSAAPGVGTRLPGGAAGGPDRRRHHGVGGRGEGPHVYGDATAGGAADGGLLPTQPAVHALRRVPGARLADRDGRGGRGLWAPGEGSHGAVGDALDHRRRTGGARPAGGAAQLGIGMPIGSFIGSSNISGYMAPSAPAPAMVEAQALKLAA